MKIEALEIRTDGLYVRCNGRFLGAKQTFDLIRAFNHQLSFDKVTTKQSFSGFYLTKAKTRICHSVRFVNSKLDLGLRLGGGFGVFLTTKEKILTSRSGQREKFFWQTKMKIVRALIAQCCNPSRGTLLFR